MLRASVPIWHQRLPLNLFIAHHVAYITLRRRHALVLKYSSHQLDAAVSQSYFFPLSVTYQRSSNWQKVFSSICQSGDSFFFLLLGEPVWFEELSESQGTSCWWNTHTLPTDVNAVTHKHDLLTNASPGRTAPFIPSPLFALITALSISDILHLKFLCLYQWDMEAYSCQCRGKKINLNLSIDGEKQKHSGKKWKIMRKKKNNKITRKQVRNI